MAKVKGAQGMEIIPNIAFWKDLPFLIKVTGTLYFIFSALHFLFLPCHNLRNGNVTVPLLFL